VGVFLDNVSLECGWRGRGEAPGVRGSLLPEAKAAAPPAGSGRAETQTLRQAQKAELAYKRAHG
jgi:hypothetical protein